MDESAACILTSAKCNNEPLLALRTCTTCCFCPKRFGDGPSAMQPFCAGHFAGFTSLTHTSDCISHFKGRPPGTELRSAGHVSVCLVAEWPSVCFCLAALFRQAATYILKVFHPADIGITTTATSNVSSTCILLAFMASLDHVSLDLTLSVSNRSYEYFSAAVKSAVLLTMTVSVDACQCMSLNHATQHNLACLHTVSDTISMSQAFYQALHISACIWAHVPEIRFIKKKCNNVTHVPS